MRIIAKNAKVAIAVAVFWGPGAVYALFPRSEIGALVLTAYEWIFGLAALAFAFAIILHFAEQLYRSYIRLKRERHEPWEPLLLGDDVVRVFAGWVEKTGLVIFLCVIYSIFIMLIGMAAFIVSLGHLGFMPDFKGIP
jgi:hypothetical protein